MVEKCEGRSLHPILIAVTLFHKILSYVIQESGSYVGKKVVRMESRELNALTRSMHSQALFESMCVNL